MRVAEHQLVTADGVRLAVTLHEPPSNAAGRVAVIAGAVGVTRRRYADLSVFLASEGWTVVSFDYRGIGDSRLDRLAFARATMQQWAEHDVVTVLDWASREVKHDRLVAITHSVGGQLIGMAPNKDKLDAMMAVGVQKGYWRFWTGPYKLIVYLFFRYYVDWNVRVFGRLPLGFTNLEDLPPEVARDWARWGRADDYLDAEYRSLKPRFASFRAPILALSFTDDQYYAPKAAVDALFSSYFANAPALRCHVDPAAYSLQTIGHSGFFDRRICPVTWWKETSDWLKAPWVRSAGSVYPPDSLWLSVQQDGRNGHRPLADDGALAAAQG